jgi:DNA-binding NtrC family response regulator
MPRRFREFSDAPPARSYRGPVTPTELRAVVAVSPAMRRLMDDLARVAEGDTTVLLQGETGSGKEVLARTLHERSRRRNGPFVEVDCGSLPETLLDAELSGHVRGAFTGAEVDRIGLFEQANGGTLFLDEVQEASPAVQSRLLRLAAERELRSVGSSAKKRVDVRLIAATNRPSHELVEAGALKKDLFYRLNVFELDVPPLRQRIEDIPELVRQILADLSGRSDVRLSADAMTCLLAQHWPGNIRELRSVVERAWILTRPKALIEKSSIPDRMHNVPADVDRLLSYREFIRTRQREYLERQLARWNGNINQAARSSGLPPPTFRRHMLNLGLRAGCTRPGDPDRPDQSSKPERVAGSDRETPGLASQDSTPGATLGPQISEAQRASARAP